MNDVTIEIKGANNVHRVRLLKVSHTGTQPYERATSYCQEVQEELYFNFDRVLFEHYSVDTGDLISTKELNKNVFWDKYFDEIQNQLEYNYKN